MFKKPFSLSSWDQVMHLLIKISKLLLIPWSSKSSNFISINFEVASKVIFFKELGFNKHSMNKNSRELASVSKIFCLFWILHGMLNWLNFFLKSKHCELFNVRIAILLISISLLFKIKLTM